MGRESDMEGDGMGNEREKETCLVVEEGLNKGLSGTCGPAGLTLI